MHWMISDVDLSKNEGPKTPMHLVWREMEGLVRAGKTKGIGVSNGTIPMIFDMLNYCEIKPVVNQVELHPYLVMKDFVKVLKGFGIEVIAYAPLGAYAWYNKEEKHKTLNLLSEEIIVNLASKYSKTPAQIVLNWHSMQGHIFIPKTSSVIRLKENKEIFDFILDESDKDLISSLNIGARFYGKDFKPYFE